MYGNWIRQTTTGTGTGPYTLDPVSGFPTFANQFSVGHLFTAEFVDNTTGAPFMAVEAHLSDSTTLVVDKVLATYSSGTYSDNDPAALSLPAGTKRVVCALEQGSIVAPMPNLNTSATNRVLYPTGVATTASAASYSVVGNTMYYVPFQVKTPCTIDAILFRNTTTGTKARVGLYTVGINGKPNLLVDQSPDVVTTATGLRTTGTLTKRRLKPGWYFLALLTAENLTVNSCSSIVDPVLGGDANGVGSNGVLWESVSSGWSSMPSTANVTSGVFDISQTPLLMPRVA